jgi:carotenoid cleavage dioxygenase-like enzyme
MSTNAAFDATKGPTFPRSMMHASAQELKSIKLNLIAGNLPQGLQGYLFLVAPVGSVSSIGLPNPDDSHVWNGNGLIHRFDFQAGESVVLTTRIARTPCYWADPRVQER